MLLERLGRYGLGVLLHVVVGYTDANAGNWGGVVVVMIVRNGARLIGSKGEGASAKGGSRKARCFMLTPVCGGNTWGTTRACGLRWHERGAPHVRQICVTLDRMLP